MTSISILMSNMDKPLGGFPNGMPRSLSISLSSTMFGLMRAASLLLLIAIALLISDTGPKADTGSAVAPILIVGFGVAVGLRMLRVTYLLSKTIPARQVSTAT